MGRPRKPLWQHELEGTYRADRHGPRESERPAYTRLYEEPEPQEREFHIGLDCVMAPRMLIAAPVVALLFDVTEGTIRRWTKRGYMPQPRRIAGRVLWSADELRQWIADDCPRLDGGEW